MSISMTSEKYRDLDEVLDAIRNEFLRARNKHSPLASAHEGYAVILEELDETWDEIKRDDFDAAREEAVQVGAMAVAFILET